MAGPGTPARRGTGPSRSRLHASCLLFVVAAAWIRPVAPMVAAASASAAMGKGPSVPPELRRQHRIAEDDQEEIGGLAESLKECQRATAEHLQDLTRQNEEVERAADVLSKAVWGGEGGRNVGTLEERMEQLEHALLWADEGFPDGGAGGGGGGAMEMEMGSTPVGRHSGGDLAGGAGGAQGSLGLRGGGGGGALAEEGLRGLNLRGGGNAPSYPDPGFKPAKSKYTQAEHKVNKAMCKAVTAGKEEEVRRLLKAGADPSYPHCGPLDFSVMHHAVNTKQMRIVEMLQSHGGNVKQRCALGWTLLHQAAYLGDLDMCQRIINMGVDITVMNNARRTPPQVAKTNGHKQCAQALWKIQEVEEVKKGGHAPKGEPQDGDDDEEDDPEDSDKEREHEEAARAAEAAKKGGGKRK